LQLLAFGLSAAAVRHRVAIGQLHRVHAGVYCVGYPRLTRKGYYMAAVELPRFRGQGLIRSFRRYWSCCRSRTVRNPKGYAQFRSFSRALAPAPARDRASARCAAA
jgi:hypothetical protein